MRRSLSFVGCLVITALALFAAGDPAPAVAQERAVPEITVIGPTEAWNREQYEGLQLLMRSMDEIGLKATYVATPNWPAFPRFQEVAEKQSRTLDREARRRDAEDPRR